MKIELSYGYDGGWGIHHISLFKNKGNGKKDFYLLYSSPRGENTKEYGEEFSTYFSKISRIIRKNGGEIKRTLRFNGYDYYDVDISEENLKQALLEIKKENIPYKKV